MATRKVIESGDLIVVDIGPVYQGYCADICRTFSVGEPSPKAAELYNLYYRMQTTALNEAQPGRLLHRIEEQIEKLLDEGGYRDYYLRGFIHGIGLGPMALVIEPLASVQIELQMGYFADCLRAQFETKEQ